MAINPSVKTNESMSTDEYTERVKYLFDEWKKYYDLSKGKSEKEWIETC